MARFYGVPISSVAERLAGAITKLQGMVNQAGYRFGERVFVDGFSLVVREPGAGGPLPKLIHAAPAQLINGVIKEWR